MITQYIYLSFIKKDYIAQNTFHDILNSSIKNNVKDGITGVLLFKSRVFIQLLEGPEDKVEATFQRIIQDPRHENIKLLAKQKVQDRLYGEWSMHFREVTEEDLAVVNLILPWSTLVDSNQDIPVEKVQEMIQKFRELI